MGITLKAARVNAGLTQEEAAKLIGVNVSSICKWESYSAFPSTRKLPLILDAYKTDYGSIDFLPKIMLKAEFESEENAESENEQEE